MNKLLALTLLFATTLFADETLTLTWLQPPGYQSTLYYATNLNGSWSSFGVVNPPIQELATNKKTFFYVVVAPVHPANPIVNFVADPNSEGVTPEFTNQPALAYDTNGTIGIYVWNIRQQQWN